jgi:Cu/Ag efflux pump CusA
VAATQQSLTSVRNLLIDTPSGGHVRLGDVAHLRIRPNPVDIRHEAVSRYVDVGADVRGRDLAEVQRDVERRLRGLSFPLEYHAEVLKASPAGQTSTSHTGFVTFAIAAAIGMFLLLQAAFGSWRLASLVFTTLPLAVVGGWLVALATGNQDSLGAYGGMLAVFGLAVRHAIMLVARFQHEERHNGHSFGSLLVLRGARERLSPTLMSTVTTALAVLPLVALGAVPGNEITQPMAEVILGGLVTSTLLNLFVLPAAYPHFRGPAPQPTHDAADGVIAAPHVDVHQ